MADTNNRAQRADLEHELQTIRAAIRALREAAESAQDQGPLFELERAQEKEVQLLRR